jgi:hypothetical protein
MMRHCPAPARLEGQPRLGAIQSLNLAGWEETVASVAFTNAAPRSPNQWCT